MTGEEASLEDGMTQLATRKTGSSPRFVFNFPVEISFRSTNPFGWPKIVITLSEKDFRGKFPIVGYGWVHLPLFPGDHDLTVRLFRPQSSSMIQSILSFITGKYPEFINPTFVSEGEGREVTRVTSDGFVKLKINVMTKDVTSFGFS